MLLVSSLQTEWSDVQQGLSENRLKRRAEVIKERRRRALASPFSDKIGRIQGDMAIDASPFSKGAIRAMRTFIHLFVSLVDESFSGESFFPPSLKS